MLLRAGGRGLRRACLLQQRWCAAAGNEVGPVRDAVAEAVRDHELASAAKAGWLLLGGLDTPLAFTPSEDAGTNVVRAEQEMYRLYREVESGTKHWTELQDLHTLADAELTATAFMWNMYLKVIPEYRGVGREYQRLLNYRHDFDITTVNTVMKRRLQFQDYDRVLQMWRDQLHDPFQSRSEPNRESFHLLLEALLPPDAEDSLPQRRWWMERGVTYVPCSYHEGPSMLTPYHTFANFFTTKKWRCSSHRTLWYVAQFIRDMEKFRVRPNVTTLHLLVRVLPLNIDYGRELAGHIVQLMDTLTDEECPMEARLLITEFLHWKLELTPLEEDMSVMKGAPMSTNHKLAIVFDDFLQFISAPFRPPGWQPRQ